MNNFSFKILNQDKKTKARLGLIHTPHGDIETPSFVPVGTLGTVKSLTPDELKQIGCQVVLANTYHLYLRPGDKIIKKLGGLHKFMGWNGPLITDSGGFQVFSLGLAHKNFNTNKNKLMTKITDKGVIFHSHLDGSLHEFTPEKSIKIQENLGSDMIIAFDHCPPYPATHKYVEEAVERTFLWAKRCQEAQKFLRRQTLYGVIQGGIYQDLRIKSAKQIVSLDFPAFAIGGVAVGENKKEMYQAVKWVNPYLPKEKPVHLLGVGEIDDLVNCIEWGIDTFDCVAPTRLGRMGQFYTTEKEIWGQKKWQADIFKSKFYNDLKSLEKNCSCLACQNFSRAYLHHLFKNEELLGYRLLSLHNLYFINNLLKKIRQAIKTGNLEQIKKEILS